MRVVKIANNLNFLVVTIIKNMEFYIKKGATLPQLRFKIVKDGRSDYNRFYNYVSGDTLYFSMFDYQTKIPKVSSRKAKFVKSEIDEEYYAVYQLKNRDTNKVGRYEAQFLLKTDEGTIVFPVEEKLYVNVTESITAEILDDGGCYTSDNPCCPVPSFTPTNTPSVTPTMTVTPSYTPTLTPTMTVTPTPSPTCPFISNIITSSPNPASSDGQVWIYINGGTGIITTTDGTTTVTGSAAIFTGLTAGTYNYTITDTYCTIYTAVTLTESTQNMGVFSPTPNIPAPCICSGATLEYSIVGGDPSQFPVTIDVIITQSETSSTIIQSGSCTSTNIFGCLLSLGAFTQSGYIILNINDTLGNSYIQNVGPICAIPLPNGIILSTTSDDGSGNGSVTIYAYNCLDQCAEDNICAGPPFTYSLSSGPISFDGIFTNLSAGVYNGVVQNGTQPVNCFGVIPDFDICSGGSMFYSATTAVSGSPYSVFVSGGTGYTIYSSTVIDCDGLIPSFSYYSAGTINGVTFNLTNSLPSSWSSQGGAENIFIEVELADGCVLYNSFALIIP
jgi:hypothetical protein